MSVKIASFQAFYSGQSTDKKVGPKASFAYSQALDFRKAPSQMSSLPRLVREDKDTIKDLVLKEVMTNDGTIYAFGNAGYVYRRSTSGVWSNVDKLNAGTGGMDYRIDTDAIYLTSSRSVSFYNQINKTPVIYPDYYGPSYSTYDNSDNMGFNVAAYQAGSIATTAISTTIIENDTNLRYFQTDIEPLVKISVFISDKGTGDWTLTLHDGLNTVLGTNTIVSANIKVNQFNDFFFTAATDQQVRVYPAPNARTYHIHVTSSNGTGTITSSSVNNMSTADLEVWADRMVVTKNGLHPMIRFQQYEAIGNGNYLSIWEPISNPPTNTEWLRHALVFPQEYEVCSLAVQNEFIVIGAGKTTTGSGTPQAGILFFWNGTSPTYDYFVEIPEGTPYSLKTYKNTAYYLAGGAWYGITGVATEPVKIRTMPGSDADFSIGYPEAMTVRKGVLLTGYPSITTNQNIEYGVYSWGSIEKNYPNSFGYSYVLSTGDKNLTGSNNLSIGMTTAFGDLLHVSWRDDNGTPRYGVDVVNSSSPPAAVSLYQTPIIDNSYVAKFKSGLFIEAYYDLPAGATIMLSYSIDRGSFINDTQTYSTTNLWNKQPGYARFNITNNNGGRFRELQGQITITCPSTATVAPNVYMVSLVYDDNKQEQIQ